LDELTGGIGGMLVYMPLMTVACWALKSCECCNPALGVCDREEARDAVVNPRSETNDDALDGFGASPMMGAFAGMGLPGTATLILERVPSWSTMERLPPPYPEDDAFPPLAAAAAVLAVVSPGWLYIHVAARTIELPRTNAGVIGYANNPTDAKNEMTMLSEVANPLRMLSEYLMTSAVISPPKTWVRTVPHAHMLKLRNGSRRMLNIPPPDPPDRPDWKRTGINAGTRENNDSWTFRVHRSAFDPLRTISK